VFSTHLVQKGLDVSDPTAGAASCRCSSCPSPTFCRNCDLLLGLDGFYVIDVAHRGEVMVVMIESAPGVEGCRSCGVVAVGHGRVEIELIDRPWGAGPVRLVWRKRRWRCPEPSCPVVTFVETDDDIALPRGLLTRRAVAWCVGQMRRENASVRGLARQMAVAWGTVWAVVKPLLAAAADDESRFAGVRSLGVDEHTRHHGDQRKYGPKMLTGMVDLTPSPDGKPRARLLDLVPGRSGAVYKQWLTERGERFTSKVQVATLDPFHGYKNAIDDELQDAVAVLDAFHVHALSSQMVDDVRRRVQQQTTGHRGRKGDPLYGIRNTLRCAQENLTDRQRARLTAAFTADPAHEEVYWAWRIDGDLRAAYDAVDPRKGRDQARRLLHTLRTCPIPEARRLGKTLRRWRDAFLAYWTERGASNGGTEAMNGLIELARRVARGIPNADNYRLRMLLITGALDTVINP